MIDLSIYAENYKCFKQGTGFDLIQRVNLIIGRNNVGKSSLLDIIEAVTTNHFDFKEETWNGDKKPRIIFSSTIRQETVNKCFPVGHSGGDVPGSHDEYGKRYIGRRISWARSDISDSGIELISCQDEGINPDLKNSGRYSTALPKSIPIELHGKLFRRLSAERDINPEVENIGTIEIKSNGTGITNAIQCFINMSNVDLH